jgi:hypothetical protein
MVKCGKSECLLRVESTLSAVYHLSGGFRPEAYIIDGSADRHELG